MRKRQVPMSQQNVQRFFENYIFGFIKSDIQREIGLARAGEPAGNFLSALGLLCYTEFMGGIAIGGFDKGTARSRFNIFFNSMGHGYKELNKQVNVYDVFRCGMAHQYFIKKNCMIAILKTNETVGISLMPNGQYYFIVEKYFEDFMAACETLYRCIINQPNPFLPST